MIKDIGIAKLDVFREFRSGKPEAIFAQGKNLEDLIKIVKAYLEFKDSVLVTKLNSEQMNALKSEFKDCYINILTMIAK